MQTGRDAHSILVACRWIRTLKMLISNGLKFRVLDEHRLNLPLNGLLSRPIFGSEVLAQVEATTVVMTLLTTQLASFRVLGIIGSLFGLLLPLARLGLLLGPFSLPLSLSDLPRNVAGKL